MAPFDVRLMQTDCAVVEKVAPELLSKRPSILKSDAFLCNQGLKQFCAVNSLEATPTAWTFTNTAFTVDPAVWGDDKSHKQA